MPWSSASVRDRIVESGCALAPAPGVRQPDSYVTRRGRKALGIGLVVAMVASLEVPALSFVESPTTEVTKFFPSVLSSNDGGWTIAMDGPRIVLGLPRSDLAGQDSGAVYVLRRSGGMVVEEAQIVPADTAPFAQFGFSLVSREDVLLVSAPQDSEVAPAAGSVYVYDQSGTSWVQRGKLFASDAQLGDAFGTSLSLSGDWLAVGAAFEDGNGPPGTESGAVYMFRELAPNLWIEQQKLVASDASMDAAFGRVAIQGTDLFVGVPSDDERGDNAGALYRFELQSNTWVEREKILPANLGAGHRFGRSLAIEGTRLVVGAPRDRAGAVYVYERVVGAWVETAKIDAPDLNGGFTAKFGEAVALEDDNILVGEPLAGSGNARGAAFVYSRSGDDGWVQQSFLQPSDVADLDGFGLTVAISDGVVVAHSPGDDDHGSDSGSAYLFRPGAPTVYCQGKTSSLGCVPFIAAEGLPSVSSTEPFRIVAHEAVPGELGLLLYGFAKTSLPFHGGTLCIKSPFRRVLPAKLAKVGGVQPCAGVLKRNFNTLIQNGSDPALTTGQIVRTQWRQRDPADPTGFGDTLTDALQFTIGP